VGEAYCLTGYGIATIRQNSKTLFLISTGLICILPIFLHSDFWGKYATKVVLLKNQVENKVG
jgi:hypothetical protein